MSENNNEGKAKHNKQKRPDANDRMRAGIDLWTSAKWETYVVPAKGARDDYADWLKPMPLHRTQDGEGGDEGKVKATWHNAFVILRDLPDWKGVLRFNERSQQIEIIKRMWVIDRAMQGGEDIRILGDEECRAIAFFLSEITEANFTEAITWPAIRYLADRAKYDPVKTYLESVIWDGVPRLDSWLTKYLGAEPTEWHRAVGRRWLISAVARAFKPGCQADHVLVLEGRQGLGKTTALRILGGEYHADDPPPLGDDRSKQFLLGLWIVEVGELDAYKRQREATAVKNFLSATKDRFRMPYAREFIEAPRRVVFAATTNESDYLHDSTGNRRIWPVRCGQFDKSALTADRDQLWAEAVHAFTSGEPWYLETDELVKLAEASQAERYNDDPWTEDVLAAAKTLEIPTTTNIMDKIGINERREQNHPNAGRIARILTAHGYESAWRKLYGRAHRVWVTRSQGVDVTGT